MPKWSSDLKYGPCPPTRDFGSRVPGFVFLTLCITFSVSCYTTEYPVLSICLSVGRLVGQLVSQSHLTFLFFCILLPHCSCPNALVTSNAAQKGTGVAAYPALVIPIEIIFHFVEMGKIWCDRRIN